MILALWYHNVLAFFFSIIAILLMVVILLQRGKGVGLAGAFGGTGGSSAFGAKTGDFLTWFTVIGAGIFLLSAILLNYIFVPGPPQLAPNNPAPQSPAPTGDTGSRWQSDDATGRLEYAQQPIFGEDSA
ncbi:MAG: preprotein translocase subunit SecG [Planctomycetota bacterium]